MSIIMKFLKGAILIVAFVLIGLLALVQLGCEAVDGIVDAMLEDE